MGKGAGPHLGGAGGDANGGAGGPSGNWACVSGALRRGAEPSPDVGVVEARRGGVVGVAGRSRRWGAVEARRGGVVGWGRG